MADRTWTPEVVEAVGRRIDPERWAQLDAMDPSDRAFLPLMIAERMRVDAALASSPLPAALDLIERMATVMRNHDVMILGSALSAAQRGFEAGSDCCINFEAIAADAAAFVARVREG